MCAALLYELNPERASTRNLHVIFAALWLEKLIWRTRHEEMPRNLSAADCASVRRTSRWLRS